MAAPIVYRWDDGNAPVARGERRSLCDILYACLVTGYGTKPGAGWTREYVNATFDKAAFRNNPITGTGFYLQVDGAGGTDAMTPKVRGFEAMTSESDGLGPFNATYQYLLSVSQTAGTTPRPWVLIADDRFFYFYCMPNSAASPAPVAGVYVSDLMFGDIIRLDQNDAFGCIIHASINTMPGCTSVSAVATEAYSSFGSPRPISGVATPTPLLFGFGGGPGCENGQYGVSGITYVPGNPVLYSQPYLNNKLANTFRGWLPGFYIPCHPNAFGLLQQVPVDGGTMLSLRGIVLGGWGNWFISLSDWRA